MYLYDSVSVSSYLKTPKNPPDDSSMDGKIEASELVVEDKPQSSVEQRAEIERKRLAAIKSNKFITLIKTEDFKKVSSFKATPPFKNVITLNRANPYLKPQVQNIVRIQKVPEKVSNQVAERIVIIPATSPQKAESSLTSNRINLIKKPVVTTVVLSKPAVPMLISLEMISPDRFSAKTEGYSDAVITQFKKLRTKSFGELKKI